ncbi:MAG: hypothetical protein EA386_08595 [Rhodobacteraceae bacterium]|nr:MAG: hypothetical protein EA386_08595 [Paracoccaceae bacterium]
MTIAVTDKALVQAPPTLTDPANSMIVNVARQSGISPLRQFAQIIALRGKRNGLSATEYYAMGVFNPELSAADRRCFVGRAGNRHLNRSMRVPGDKGITSFVENKLTLEAALRGIGLPTTSTQAVLSKSGAFGGMAHLHTEQDFRDFLRKDAEFPIFAKPAGGSLGVGAALLLAYDATQDMIELGSGKTVGLKTFVDEALGDHGKGLLLQKAVRQHQDMTRIAGPALGCIRVVTTSASDGPRTLYAIWKLPAPKAISDNSWQEGGMLAEIDHATGKVQQVRKGEATGIEVLQRHPQTEEILQDITLPFADRITRIAEAAHALFPTLGLIGWDIGISQDGPVILEANGNPHHMLYQRATGQGILNDRFLPRIKEVQQRMRKRLGKA